MEIAVPASPELALTHCWNGNSVSKKGEAWSWRSAVSLGKGAVLRWRWAQLGGRTGWHIGRWQSRAHELWVEWGYSTDLEAWALAWIGRGVEV